MLLNGKPTSLLQLYKDKNNLDHDEQMYYAQALKNVNPMKLSWEIAKEASEYYRNGSKNEYHGKVSTKMAQELKNIYRSNKENIDNKTESYEIIQGIADDVRAIGVEVAEASNTTDNHVSIDSLDIQIDRLYNAMLSLKINGKPATETGFFKFCTSGVINPLEDIEAFFYGSNGQVENGTRVIDGIESVMKNLRSAIPAFLTYHDKIESGIPEELKGLI